MTSTNAIKTKQMLKREIRNQIRSFPKNNDQFLTIKFLNNQFTDFYKEKIFLKDLKPNLKKGHTQIGH